MDLAQYLPKNLNFNFKLGNLNFAPSVYQAVAIVVLLFLLILMMAQVRRHLLDWSIKGAFFGIFFGFLLALILEGFLLVGGRTALTEVLGWKNPPKPVQVVLDAGRAKITQVLGITAPVPSSYAEDMASYESVIESFQSLTPTDAKKAKSLICQP